MQLLAGKGGEIHRERNTQREKYTEREIHRECRLLESQCVVIYGSNKSLLILLESQLLEP